MNEVNEVKRRNRLAGRTVAALALMATIACGPSEKTVSESLSAYLDAVQAENLERLFCLSAGASAAPELGAVEAERRSSFEVWARGEYAAYLDGRDAGRVELDDGGIRTVRLFALGRGTFYTVGAARAAGTGGLRVATELRFGYDQLDLSRFSVGTTLYLNGTPPGRIHALRIPAGPGEVSLEVLDALTLEWSLVLTEPRESCPGGWAVASVVPVAGSARTTDLEWTFY